MKTTFHSLHRHITAHHKKYLFGIFGGFAVVKLFLLVIGLTVVQQTIITNAQLDSGCVLTGQYYTGEYQTGEYYTGEYQTGGYYTGCTTLSGYRTGIILDESGTQISGMRVEEPIETGCEFTGRTLTGGYYTGSYLTGGYRTGGTVVCETQLSGNNQTGTNQTGTLVLGNGICESGDIIWSKPLSGTIVRNIFDVQWNYSGLDCLISGLSLQLRDHNNQWISLSTFASGTTSYIFDSRRLYSFQTNGFYHIIGNTGAGNFMLYSGIATGTYSRLFTGYKLRLLTPTQTSFYETSPFTIDNTYPTLSGITLLSSGSATGYVALSGVATLSFIASEELSGLQVTLGSGKTATSSTVSGLLYTYTRTITSLYPEGTLAAKILFADKAGNTGSLVYTSAIIFDVTRPTITGFVFTESTHGIYLNFTSSEQVKTTFNYWMAGTTFMSGTNASYLTAHQLDFSGIQRDQLYTYTVDVFDHAGNARSVTGDFMRTNLGQIISHVNVVPVVSDVLLSGNVATLATVLKSELHKFNACKDALTYTNIELEIRRTAFLIHMPDFKKSQIKTLVNAFTLFVLDQIKKDYKITKVDIEDITKKFDKFLVVLKLLRDDDNECKQNLSTYHISQFQKALEEYKIVLE